MALLHKKFWEELIAYFTLKGTDLIVNDESKNTSIVVVYSLAL
jgi:hypothetical protein